MDGMKVTAKYESGKTSRLAKGAYVVRGLNNNSVGKHNMTISSGGAECRISYTINNYTKSLTYSWPTKDECYTEMKIFGWSTYRSGFDGRWNQTGNYQI